MSSHTEYEDDKKHAVEHVDHSSGSQGFAYPETLRAMPDAPSQELLVQALEDQKAEQGAKVSTLLARDWRLVLFIIPYLISCMGTGFDNGAMNITGSMPAFLIKYGGFDPVTKSLSIASKWLSTWNQVFFLGNAIGSFACFWLLDRFGPRKVNFFGSIFMIIPIALQALSNSHGMLAAGKFLAGIPLGMFTVASANFISEASSTRLRAPLSSTIAFAAVGGIVLGIATGAQVIGRVEPTGWKSWRLTLAMQWIFPVLTAIGMLFVPTSPVYLVKRGLPADAAAVLRKINGGDDVDAQKRLACIQYSVALEQEQQQAIGPSSYKDLFSNPVDRRRTFTSMAIWAVFHLGGNSFLGQGLYFLQQQGLNIVIATDITLGMLALAAVTNFFAGYIIEKLGRRFCFVYFNAFHGLFMGAIGVLGFFNHKSSGAGWALAVFMNLAISTQQFATNGPGYALTAEISSLRLRAKTQSLSLLVLQVLNWITAIVIPYIFQSPGYLGAKTAFIFFGGTLAIGVPWSYFYIPETKGRTTEEIDILYEHRIPPRHFAKTDVQALLAEKHHAT